MTEKAFAERSAAGAKVLLERDRRSAKIEIGNGQKEGGCTLHLPLQSGPVSVLMAVLLALQDWS